MGGGGAAGACSEQRPAGGGSGQGSLSFCPLNTTPHILCFSVLFLFFSFFLHTYWEWVASDALTGVSVLPLNPPLRPGGQERWGRAALEGRASSRRPAPGDRFLTPGGLVVPRARQEGLCHELPRGGRGWARGPASRRHKKGTGLAAAPSRLCSPSPCQPWSRAGVPSPGPPSATSVRGLQPSGGAPAPGTLPEMLLCQRRCPRPAASLAHVPWSHLYITQS